MVGSIGFYGRLDLIALSLISSIIIGGHRVVPKEDRYIDLCLFDGFELLMKSECYPRKAL